MRQVKWFGLGACAVLGAAVVLSFTGCGSDNATPGDGNAGDANAAGSPGSESGGRAMGGSSSNGGKAGTSGKAGMGGTTADMGGEPAGGAPSAGSGGNGGMAAGGTAGHGGNAGHGGSGGTGGNGGTAGSGGTAGNGGGGAGGTAGNGGGGAGGTAGNGGGGAGGTAGNGGGGTAGRSGSGGSGGGDTCDQCDALHCSAAHEACLENDPACHTLLACIHTQGCAVGSARDGAECYCGADIDNDTCFNSFNAAIPQGPCKAEYEAAAGSNIPLSIGQIFYDLTTSVGSAQQSIACEITDCTNECGL